MGLFDWAKKKGSNAKEESKKLLGTEEIKKNASFIASMAKVLFNPKETTKNAKQETFMEAKKRLNINEADLIKVYKNHVWSFYLSLLFALFCLFVLLINVFSFNFVGIFSSLAILLVCLSQCFKFSFRAFQIRHQKLCPVSDWTKRPAEWFPTIG